MGRKIPAKKHRGVKDPLVQQAKRLQKLKGKVNAPPKDPDEQPVPKSLTQLFAFQNRKKRNNNDLKEKKKKHLTKDKDCTKSQHDNPIAKLQRLPGESGRGFSLRINSAIKAIHNPTVQGDYPLESEMEDRKGEQMAVQRARRKKKQKKVATDSETTPKPSRAHKLTLKKKAKKEKALEVREHEREVRYDQVCFGEVAHAPPVLPVRPRHAAVPSTAPRPGRKALLLSALLSGDRRSQRQPPPAVETERRERARLAAVAAYRALRSRPAPPRAPPARRPYLL